MPGIVASLPFHPMKIADLTISDTRPRKTDTLGAWSAL